MLCSVQFGSVNSKAVELCCDETRFGEVGRGMARRFRFGLLRRGVVCQVPVGQGGRGTLWLGGVRRGGQANKQVVGCSGPSQNVT